MVKEVSFPLSQKSLEGFGQKRVIQVVIDLCISALLKEFFSLRIKKSRSMDNDFGLREKTPSKSSDKTPKFIELLGGVQ